MARPLLLTNRRYVFLFSVSLMSYSLFKFKFSVQIIYYLRNNLFFFFFNVGLTSCSCNNCS